MVPPWKLPSVTLKQLVGFLENRENGEVKHIPLSVLLVASLLGFETAVRCEPAANAADGDTSLQAKLEKRIDGFHGDAGIYVRHLGTGQTAAVEADTLFPTASMIKIPIAVGIFDQIEKGNLTLDQKLTFDPEAISYPAGQDIVASLRTGETISLSKLVLLMLALSDNNASLWCQALAGTGARINELMEVHGFDQIKVNSRTDGRRPDWENYGWGQTTPRQMGELLAAIREERVVSPWASQSMYRYLSGSAFHGEALSFLPPFVQAATKQGAVSQSRSEVVLVNAPSGDYVFCVITKNQEDKGWSDDNEGYVLIRDLSRILWEHFEPTSDWKPATREKQ